jgi:2-succinyl-6-hydroxy-2,4-cyclohexadiene-1-carboxylate synthase
MTLVCLHGFLGLPSDWDFLGDVITPPLDAIPREGDTLIGYSMGGRLALQALLGGARYRRAILISTRVSPADPDRRERDEAWARRFESDDWETLMRDWNAQPIFGGHTMPRAEKDFDREELARQLREWSPAVLPPIDLRSIDIPTLWIAGARDETYVAEAKRGAELTGGEIVIVEGAAHRVPWEASDTLRRHVDRDQRI